MAFSLWIDDQADTCDKCGKSDAAPKVRIETRGRRRDEFNYIILHLDCFGRAHKKAMAKYAAEQAEAAQATGAT